LNIGIYSDYWGSVGGGARFVGVLAEALAEAHDVELVHHCDHVSPASYGEAIGVDLSRIGLRWVPRRRPVESSLNPLRRLAAAREQLAEVSRPYDLFINATDTPPPFCHAPWGVALVQFPMTTLDSFYGRDQQEWRSRSAPMKLAARAYQQLEWKLRFAGYRVILCNSRFGAYWLKRYWGVDAIPVYPPLRTGLWPVAKANTIISVGRYSTSKAKDQLRLIEAFKAVHDSDLTGWSYTLVGSTRPGKATEEYLDELRTSAAGYPVRILTDLPSSQLAELLGSASIFWHSKGFGVDPFKRPDLMEHFGMVTPEAMASGCVPVVYAGGGQPEIVNHGVDGYLWKSIDELVARTVELAWDADARDRMAGAARLRSEAFSKERTIEAFMRAIDPLIG
jgi:glycosyltransferase involved in cell wall biosynthesis